MSPTWTPFAGRALIALVAAAASFGCSAPDPLPARAAGPPPGRMADGLLERPALQAVAEATLARDTGRLIEALSDPDPRVRARAAYGLGSVQAPEAVPTLESLLSDADARVREDAAFALGQTDGGVGRPLMDALAGEQDRRVRGAMIEAVGKRGGAEELAGLLGIGDPALLPGATLALSRGVTRGEVPDGVVDTLIARMSHPEPDVRAAAAYLAARAEALPAWGTRYREVADVLAGYHPDDEAAMHLLVGLGRAVTVFTQPVDLAWVHRPDDWRIRANAAVAAAATYEARPQTGPVLLAALGDPSPHVRQRAAEALGAAPASPEVREGVLAQVARNPGDRAMVGPLLPLLTRLGEMALIRRHMQELPPYDRPGWAEALRAVEQLPGPFAVPELAAVVRTPNAPDATALDAALTLREMWGTARAYPDAVGYFEPVLDSVAREAEPSRVVPLVRVLADSLLLDRGSEALLRSVLERAEADRVRDAIEQELAAAADPRARALAPGVVADSASGAVAGVVAGAGVDPAAAEEAADGDGGADRTVLAVDWAVLAELGAHPRWVLDTDKGRVIIALRTEEAPLTVQMIAELTRQGRYDGVPFHRVIPNFVAQGGDVGDVAAGLVSEFTRTPYLRGVLGMASAGKDTETSQFFVTHSPQWHLDGGYTAFGWVEEGMAVVDRIVRGDRVLRAAIVPSR